MKLLYCYVAFTDRNGKPNPLRGMSELELNFSTTNVYRYEKQPDSDIAVLRCSRRTTPLPEDFWANGNLPTNIYNVNVIAGVNGAGKTTAIQYLMDLLNYIYQEYGQRLNDSEQYMRHDPSDNLNLLLFDTDKGLRILELHQGQTRAQLRLKGFPKVPAFLHREEAKNLLQTMKVINLTNTLTRRDHVLHSRNDERLRNNFIYDCTLGAAIGSDIAGYFSYEVYKQVAFLFAPRQLELSRAVPNQIPEMRLPRALRLLLLEQRFEKAILGITGISNSKSYSAFLRQMSLPGRLALLCVASYLDNMLALKDRKAYIYPHLLTFPGQAFITDKAELYASFTGCLGQAEDWVRSAYFSRLISGSGGISDHANTLRVWDAATGECLHILEGHTDWVNCLVILPDGRLVSVSDDLTIRVWDTATGQCLQTLEGHMKRVTCVAILPDGNLVSGSFDNTLRVWNIATGECLHTLEMQGMEVTCIAVFPDGRVISGSRDNALRVWNPATGRCLQTLKGHKDIVYCVAVLPSGNVVSGSRDKALRIWDASADRCLQILDGHEEAVLCVAVFPDGNVVSGSADHTLRVWDASTGECLQKMEGHKEAVNCVTILPDGRVVSGSKDNTLRIWDPATGRCLLVLEGHQASVECVAVLPYWNVNRPYDDKQITDRTEQCREYIDYVITDPDGLLSRFTRSEEDLGLYELPLPQAQTPANDGLEKSLVTFLDLYHKICTPYFTIDFDWGLSSGEENLLRLFSWLFHIFPRVAEDGGYRYKIRNNPSGEYDKGIECDSVLLFMDEADLTFHPEWQRRLIHILTAFLPTIYPPSDRNDPKQYGVKDMQLVLTTHSPLLLGDIPRENICFLSRTTDGTLRKIEGMTETFGQNIHTILKDSFFLENGTIGEFAAAKINAAAKRLRDLAELGEAKGNSVKAQQVDPPTSEELEKLRQIVALTAPGILRAGLEELLHRAEKAWTQKEQQQTELVQRIREASWLTEEQRNQMLQALERRGTGCD